MNENNPSGDVLHYNDDVPKAPMGLKVLTVLTFIGSALQLFGSIYNYVNAQKSYEGMDKLIEQINSDSMPSWAKAMVGDPAHLVEMITKSYQNRVPIVLLSVVAVALCVMGAIQMRKLKKQGFLFYTIGELLPFLTQFILIGAFSFSGMFFIIGTCISLFFILMYFLYRKNMVY